MLPAYPGPSLIHFRVAHRRKDFLRWALVRDEEQQLAKRGDRLALHPLRLVARRQHQHVQDACKINTRFGICSSQAAPWWLQLPLIMHAGQDVSRTTALPTSTQRTLHQASHAPPVSSWAVEAPAEIRSRTRGGQAGVDDGGVAHEQPQHHGQLRL